MIKKLICKIIGHDLDSINPYRGFIDYETGLSEIFVKKNLNCLRCRLKVPRVPTLNEMKAVEKGRAKFEE